MREFPDELDLHSCTTDEVFLMLDQYIHDAFMAGLYQVKIVHGKGTGTLRYFVKQQLSKHPLVKSFRRGGYTEGQAGVTIVDLNIR
jgi:DNA mismatch repair protein MutS2